MRRRWSWILLILVASAILWAVYVRTHPLVFMDAHQHCIKAAGLRMVEYPRGLDGRFPYHAEYNTAMHCIVSC